MIPPKYVYGISANMIKAGALIRHFMSPTEAANLDPVAFLAFAAEVEKVAKKLRAGETVQAKQLGMFEVKP